jgi:hypothetical protein
MRVLIEQTPDFAFVFAKGYVAGNVSINVVPFWGTIPEGDARARGFHHRAVPRGLES